LLSSVNLSVLDADLSQCVDAHMTKPVRQSQLYNVLATVTAGAGRGRASEEVSPAPEVAPFSGETLGRVLVAEDNPVNQKVAVRMLQKLGYRADAVANGLEAVAATAWRHSPEVGARSKSRPRLIR
jgi:PleD family two-component response regulator